MSIWLRQWKNGKGAMLQAWTVDVKQRVPGQGVVRVREVSPINTKRGAEQYEHRVRQAILDGSYSKQKAEAKAEAAAITFESFLPNYETYNANNNKPSTVASKNMLIRMHLLPFFGQMKLRSIGSAQVEEFKKAMLKKMTASRVPQAEASKSAVLRRYGKGPKPLSKKTVNNALSCLKKFFSVAIEHGAVEHAPRIRLFKTEKTEFDFLNFDEADRLLAAAGQLKLAIMVALKTGLRLGEVQALQWNDVDLIKCVLTVRRTFWRGTLGIPKGGRSRTVDMPASLVTALKGQPRQLRSSWVFADQNGDALSVKQFNMALDAATEAAGIVRDTGRIGWHDLRHTYGSHLAMRGVQLKVIQELMGHATIEMTMRYAHLSPEVKRVAVEVLDAPAGAHAGHMKAVGQ